MLGQEPPPNWHEQVQRFQKEVDANPSSAHAHEGLANALAQALVSGEVSPASDPDIVERAEAHFKQAIELAPSRAVPLVQYAALESVLAARAEDPSDRANRYKTARQSLEQAIGLDQGSADMHLKLAQLERDEFSPALRSAKSRSGNGAGPIEDADARHKLAQEYGSLINDAIKHAQQASYLASNSQRPLILLSRLLQDRSLIREKADQYAEDIRRSADYRRQFLANGGHLDDKL
jgi:tetratricopeptide (TPR) repeat protein